MRCSRRAIHGESSPAGAGAAPAFCCVSSRCNSQHRARAARSMALLPSAPLAPGQFVWLSASSTIGDRVLRSSSAESSNTGSRTPGRKPRSCIPSCEAGLHLAQPQGNERRAPCAGARFKAPRLHLSEEFCESSPDICCRPSIIPSAFRTCAQLARSEPSLRAQGVTIAAVPRRAMT